MQGPSSVNVYSLNYDFVPTIPYGAKCMWADLKWPAPEDLQVGMKVRFVSESKDLVPPRGIFYVSDIIGTRVVISPGVSKNSDASLTYFKPKKDVKHWTPLSHDYHWGYATRDLANPNPAADRNWTYGNGKPVLSMIY